MALPIITSPTFMLEVPSTKEEFKFRPFLVKEEKILTLASESNVTEDMVHACQQIVSNCSFGELDVANIPMFDLQWIFLQLRSKSVSDIQAFTLICGTCTANLPWEVNLNEFKLSGLDTMPDKKVVLDDTTGMILKYPSATTIAKADNISDADLILECIESIYTEEEVWQSKDVTHEELADFIDQLPLGSLSSISEFFESVPVLEHTIEFKCPKCESDNSVSINGYEHFFV